MQFDTAARTRFIRSVLVLVWLFCDCTSQAFPSPYQTMERISVSRSSMGSRPEPWNRAASVTAIETSSKIVNGPRTSVHLQKQIASDLQRMVKQTKSDQTFSIPVQASSTSSSSNAVVSSSASSTNLHTNQAGTSQSNLIRWNIRPKGPRFNRPLSLQEERIVADLRRISYHTAEKISNEAP